MSVFIGYPSFMAYQMMKGKKGNNDGFPSIPGMIARYSALGLTNEQMAANPVWKDLTGNGPDLQMKNFAWKGMSGVGGYVGDFSEWVNNRDTTEIGITKSNSKVIIDVKVSQGSGKNIVFISKSDLGISNNVTIKITSTYPEGVMKFFNSASNKYLKLPSNGIITLQDNPEYTSNEMHLHLASADLGQITIEQLPLYPGALVFDGVDDYGVCENFPILTKEKGYTVVALRQWITYNPNAISAIATNASDQSFNGAFTFENYNKGAEQTISYGATQISLQYTKSPFSWQTTSKYNGVDIANGSKEATNSLVLGRSYPQRNEFANFAIWELVFLDHDATEEELTKIKDYFVKTYPWLFPNQAWTVTGKTNEDKDRATIANITGNGNDLVLSNFGFAEGSGYNEEGEYAGYLVTDGVDDKIVSSVFGMGKDFTIVGDWKFIDNKKSGTGLVKGSSFYIYNTMIGLDLYINSGSVKNSLDGIKSINAACSDGRAYDRNWNEILANTGNVVGSGGTLEVSSSGGRFDRIAFKNLVIYLRILSKDDCIKAYNYLQSLKAK